MDVSGPYLRIDRDGRLPGRIDGFYIMRLTIVEKVPIFSITFIQVPGSLLRTDHHGRLREDRRFLHSV